MSGAGRACPAGLPGGMGGAPPPGLLGIAGAGLPVCGGGGGALLPPPIGPIEPIEPVLGAGRLVPGPGLGGERRGLSIPLASQSFLTGGGTGVLTVAMLTSPMILRDSLQAWYMRSISSRF